MQKKHFKLHEYLGKTVTKTSEMIQCTIKKFLSLDSSTPLKSIFLGMKGNLSMCLAIINGIVAVRTNRSVKGRTF